MTDRDRNYVVISNLVSGIVAYTVSLLVDYACGMPIALAVLLGLCVAGLSTCLSALAIQTYVEWRWRLPPPKL